MLLGVRPDDRPGEVALGALARRHAHPVRPVGVPDEGGEGIGERLGVAQRDDRPGAAVDHRVDGPGGVRRHGRDAIRGSLEHHVRESSRSVGRQSTSMRRKYGHARGT